jgi:uncharacterized protein YdaU (DUF1376 family)
MRGLHESVNENGAKRQKTKLARRKGPAGSFVTSVTGCNAESGAVMHYYKRNLGDYAKKAGRLSMLQHGSYTLLLDSCYDREQFPTLEQAIEWTWASSTEEIEAIKFVLSKFFVLSSDGTYVQERVKQELLEYQAKADTNKRIAIERETKRKEKSTNRAQHVNETPPNQEPLTTNQEPIVKALVISQANDKPDCPHQEIIAIYHEVLPQCPKVRDWTQARQTQLRTRWNESADRQNLDYWRRFFKYVGECDFLTGRTPKPFFADLEWITKTANFTKIREGKYENRGAA